MPRDIGVKMQSAFSDSGRSIAAKKRPRQFPGAELNVQCIPAIKNYTEVWISSVAPDVELDEPLVAVLSVPVRQVTSCT
jgi:hypothetical protein